MLTVMKARMSHMASLYLFPVLPTSRVQITGTEFWWTRQQQQGTIFTNFDQIQGGKTEYVILKKKHLKM